MQETLTREQVDFFNENGFLVIENFVSDQSIAKLRDRIKHIVEHDFQPSKDHAIFSTYKQDSKRDLEKYFEDSIDNISFFLEKSAKIDPETGALLQDKHKSINKIGHAIHEQDEVFREFSHQKRILQFVKSLSKFEKPIILQR